MKDKIVFIIQARLCSTRMPAKIIQPFYGGRSIIQLLLEKLKQYADCDIVLATSIDSSNDFLERIATESGVRCFRGSENDVLQRFIDAAESVNAKHIIRVCSDNPFLNEDAIKQLLERVKNSSADYISFRVNDTPSIKTHFGFWTEHVTLDALKRVKELTNESLYHEHVTNYIYAHPEEFAIEWIQAATCLEGRTDIRLTCDTPIDFQNTQEIYEALIGEHPHPTIEDIVAYVDNHPKYLQTMKEEIKKNSK